MIEHTKDESWVASPGDFDLRQRYREVPHPCSDPMCPGNINRRKLEVWPRMLAALKTADDLMQDGGDEGWTEMEDEIQLAIAEAEEVAGGN